MLLALALAGSGILGVFGLLVLNILPGAYRRATGFGWPILAGLELTYLIFVVIKLSHVGVVMAVVQAALAGGVLWLLRLRLKAHWLFLRKYEQLKKGRATTIKEALDLAYVLADAYPGWPITFSAGSPSSNEATVTIGERAVAWLVFLWPTQKVLKSLLVDFPEEERGQMAPTPVRLTLCKDRIGVFKVETFSE